MKIVVDTNRIMSALLRDGTSREIIIFGDIEFVTPEHAIEEIKKYKNMLLEKAGIE